MELFNFRRLGRLMLSKKVLLYEFEKFTQGKSERKLRRRRSSFHLYGRSSINKDFLAGEFLYPRVLQIPATSTIIDALLKSEGLNEFGSLRKVTLKRVSQSDKYYDFYDLLLKGENPTTENLLDGDIIFLPKVEKRVLVKGKLVDQHFTSWVSLIHYTTLLILQVASHLKLIQRKFVYFAKTNLGTSN